MTTPNTASLYSVANGIVPSSTFGGTPVVENRSPTSQDVNGPSGIFKIGQTWVNRSSDSSYTLTNLTTTGGVLTATWSLNGAAAGSLNTLSGNSGTAVPTLGDIEIAGSGSIITSAAGSTVTISLSGGGDPITMITGTSGGPIGPVAGNVNLLGSTLADVVGSGNTLTITPTASGYPVTPFVVGSVGKAGYQTVQSAIDAAALAGGGYVFIQPGTYVENITITTSGISLISGAVSQPMGGPLPAYGVIIQGATVINATGGNIAFTAQGIIFEATTASPAISFVEGGNSINSTWSYCTFQGTSGTAFDCAAANGNTNVFECTINASMGQKCMNIVGPQINFRDTVINGNDTNSTFSDGKIFFVDCSIVDTFDITGNPGPFLFTGGLWLALNNAPLAIIHVGASIVAADFVALSGAVSGYLFEAGGPADAGSVIYGGIITPLGVSQIDPLLSATPAIDLPFATSGTTGTAIRGSAGFNSDNFSSSIDGFISLTGSGQLTRQSITASQALVGNNAYYCTSGVLSLSLPVTAPVGTIIQVSRAGATSWTITQGAGQSIIVGPSTSTVGAGGTVASGGAGASITIECFVTDLSWIATSTVGTITVV